MRYTEFNLRGKAVDLMVRLTANDPEAEAEAQRMKDAKQQIKADYRALSRTSDSWLKSQDFEYIMSGKWRHEEEAKLHKAMIWKAQQILAKYNKPPTVQNAELILKRAAKRKHEAFLKHKSSKQTITRKRKK
jgi:hypothetical protein